MDMTFLKKMSLNVYISCIVCSPCGRLFLLRLGKILKSSSSSRLLGNWFQCIGSLFPFQGRLPVKWMAPEALFDRVYTHQSDV